MIPLNSTLLLLLYGNYCMEISREPRVVKTETENATRSVNWEPADRNRLSQSVYRNRLTEENSHFSDKMKFDGSGVKEKK